MTRAFDSLAAAAAALRDARDSRFVGLMERRTFAATCPALEMVAGAAGYDLVSATAPNGRNVQLFIVPATTPVEVQP